jgi:c(7)-type cytochrome triheme protein
MKKLLAMPVICLFLLVAAGHLEGVLSADYGGKEIAFDKPAPGVVFSHKSHVGDYGLDCDACHDGLFSMAWPEVQNNPNFTMAALYRGEYCGACHDGRSAFASSGDCHLCHVRDGGRIIYTEPVKGVVFDHQEHNKAGLACADCHGGLFAMEALSAQRDKGFAMASLYKGQFCGTCHDGSMAFASNTRCATCHVGVKGLQRTAAKGHKK